MWYPIFDPYFWFNMPNINRLNVYARIFLVREDIQLQSSKNVCPYSQWLIGHGILALGAGTRNPHFQIL